MQLHTCNTLSLPHAALWYALEGLRIFPITPGGKTPLVRWSEEATDDIGTVTAWWRQWPTANIGLAMGRGLAALDIDNKDGRDGDLSYSLVDGPQDGRWPVQRTPSGGRHVLFHTNLALRNFARRGAFDGLDCRTDGGYIVVAPSVIGGVPYRWDRGGDPSAPLPERFSQALQDWSRPTLRELAVEMPEPSELYSWDVEGMIAGLGAPFYDFLRNGESWSGDRSRDAYACCMAGFRKGWSLADMARIGPDTILAYFGADAPHGARDPWAWAWAYVVTPAWRDRQAEFKIMFEAVESPAPEAGLATGTGMPGVATGEEADSEGTHTIPPPTGDGNPVADTYDALSQAAKVLPPRDLAAMEAWMRRVLSTGIADYQVDALLREARDVVGYPMHVLMGAKDHLKAQVKLLAGRAAPAAAGVPEIFVRAQDRFYDRSSKRWISKAALASAKAREFGGDPDVVLSTYLHRADAIADVVEDLTYDPSLPPGITTDRRGTKVFNSYETTKVAPIPGDVTPWLGLLADLKVDGGAPVCNRLLDEMAYIVQNPGTKLNHGIVLGGAEGIGKDSFLAPWLDAIGRHNVSIAHGSDLESDFNAWVGHAKVAIINEVRFGTYRDRDKIAEKLKPLLAAPPSVIMVNEKNLRPYPVPNLIQPVLLTNHRDALSVEKGTRRYFCVWADADPVRAEDGAYFTRYWTWLEAGGREAVYAWLLARDVSHINPSERPMDTQWLQEMSQLATDPLSAWLIERIAEGKGLFADAGLIPREVVYAIEGSGDAALYGLRGVSASTVKRSMVRLGLKQDVFMRDGFRLVGFRIRGTAGDAALSHDGNVVNISSRRLVGTLQDAADRLIGDRTAPSFTPPTAHRGRTAAQAPRYPSPPADTPAAVPAWL